jgi:hypothetical protein
MLMRTSIPSATQLAEEFGPWVRQQPFFRRFPNNPQNCAFARFLRERGYSEHPIVGVSEWFDYSRDHYLLKKRKLDERLADPITMARHFGTLGIWLWLKGL